MRAVPMIGTGRPLNCKVMARQRRPRPVPTEEAAGRVGDSREARSVTPADETKVRIRLVGPLRVYVDGRRIADPPAGRAASLLAMPAVDADHVVPLDRIIDDLWPAGPPAKAEQNVASL